VIFHAEKLPSERYNKNYDQSSSSAFKSLSLNPSDLKKEKI